MTGRDDDLQRAKEAFYKAGWGQNEIMWKCWQQAMEFARAQSSEELAQHLDAARNANVGDVVTVWKDGTAKLWKPLDAKYSEKDPDFLSNFEVSALVPLRIRELETEIEDWRGRLANQCGETLAAREQLESTARKCRELERLVNILTAQLSASSPAVSQCTCYQYVRGSSTGGHKCPTHGQIW